LLHKGLAIRGRKKHRSLTNFCIYKELKKQFWHHIVCPNTMETWLKYIFTSHNLAQSTYTIGFWPRVRARALRAPVFLDSITHKTGRCAPTALPSELPYGEINDI
jgi:hypothetical protein